MKVVNFTVDIVRQTWTPDEDQFLRQPAPGTDFVVLYCEGQEIWRNDGTDYLGIGHGGNEYDYAMQIIANKFRELFNNLRV